MIKMVSYYKSREQFSTTEKIGQFFMPAAFINDTEEEIQGLESLIRDYAVGGLCFFHSRASAATNFEGNKVVVRNEEGFETLKNLIKRYQNASRHPLLIAIDAEWGLAMRIENTPQYPYAITLGALQNNNDLVYKVGKNIAHDCKMAGIHWNLAPCIDINNNPNNPVIGYRSFGENKIKVTEKALAFIKGTQSEGILTSIKHFPGHGDTATDSHLGLPLISKSKKELMANELYPFQKCIDAGIDSVMVGHLSVPALANGNTISSSISKDIINGVLRKEMGFDGVVISDALNMHAVSKNYPVKGELEWLAFDAGNDVLCFAEHIPEGIHTILRNASKEQIEKSFERIWKLKEKAFQNRSILSNPPPGKKGSSVALKTDTRLNKLLAENSLSLVKGTEEDIRTFRKNKFATCTIKRRTKDEDRKGILEGLKIVRSQVENKDSILLLLTPPQIKPTNNFGLLEEEIIFINEMIRTKNVVLYIFGNPYVLNLLDIHCAVSVLLVYQDFKIFQDVAAAHFAGKTIAKGQLQVSVVKNKS